MLDHKAAQVKRFAAELFVAELSAGQQHGFQQFGGVHAAAQSAAEPDALFSGFRKEGRAAGEKAAAQSQQTVAHRALRGNRADGSGAKRPGASGARAKKVRVSIEISSDIEVFKEARKRAK